MKLTLSIVIFTLFLIFGCLAGILIFMQISNDQISKITSPQSNPISKPLTIPEKIIVPQTAISHVFIIVEENHDWKSIYNNPDAPYINKTLLSQGAYAQNYHNVPIASDELHPSEPNYILLESGLTAFPDHTFTTDNSPSDDNSTSSINHITSLLEKNGYTWKSYQEDIPGTDCPINPIKDYAPKHNPAIYFQDVSGNPPSTTNTYCQSHVRPLDELKQDLANNTVPNYVFITPNLSHDMHNGTIAQADTWLSQLVPQITDSSVFKKDGALFITWDEGSEKGEINGNKPIGMIMESPFIKKGYTNDTLYSHASYVKTVEEIFHINPLAGLAGDRQTRDLYDFFIGN